MPKKAVERFLPPMYHRGGVLHSAAGRCLKLSVLLDDRLG